MYSNKLNKRKHPQELKKKNKHTKQKMKKKRTLQPNCCHKTFMTTKPFWYLYHYHQQCPFLFVIVVHRWHCWNHKLLLVAATCSFWIYEHRYTCKPNNASLYHLLMFLGMFLRATRQPGNKHTYIATLFLPLYQCTIKFAYVHGSVVLSHIVNKK